MADHSYKCLKVKQRTGSNSPEFVMFAAKVGDVKNWATIERHSSSGQSGPQRLEKPYKTRAIKSYFDVNEQNTIPTAIVLGFKAGAVKVEPVDGCGQLHDLSFTVADGESVATVVDGQHRLLGMAEFDPDLYVNVVGVLEADDVETAFQFLVINNKSAKVPSDHIRSLSLHYDEETLAERLNKVRLNLNPNLRFVGFANELDESPFQGHLSLPTNPPTEQWVTPAAIEDSINYIRSQKLPELVEDDDMLLEVFFKMWNTIKSAWPELWSSESHLLKKVSVVCVSQFLIDNLLRQYDWNNLDIFDPDAVQSEIDRIVGVLAPDFWKGTTEWTAKGLDTQSGRRLFMDSLEQMVRNNRQEEQWHRDITMIRLP